MNERTWKECISEGTAERVSRDVKKANSLRKTAEGRVAFFDSQKIREENANYIFEGLYTSLIEILHSMLVAEGYKVSNHICLTYYVRDVLKREDLFRILDDLRYKRNSLIYHGKEMDFEVAKEAVEKCKGAIREIKSLSK